MVGSSLPRWLLPGSSSYSISQDWRGEGFMSFVVSSWNKNRHIYIAYKNVCRYSESKIFLSRKHFIVLKDDTLLSYIAEYPLLRVKGVTERHNDFSNFLWTIVIAWMLLRNMAMCHNFDNFTFVCYSESCAVALPGQWRSEREDKEGQIPRAPVCAREPFEITKAGFCRNYGGKW